MSNDFKITLENSRMVGITYADDISTTIWGRIITYLDREDQ